MIRRIMFLSVILTAQIVFAQSGNTISITVKNHDTNVAIVDARITIASTGASATTDASGNATLREIPDGEQTIEIFSAGYEASELKLSFPGASGSAHTVLLELHNEMASVTVESTRTGREIETEPTRVEAIDEEEIDEKISMRPANVSMVLHESTGIQVQQTSATTNTQSIRIQGLDGRYTQILKDGFPAFGGFSGSLSVLDIPPLDLKQVEVIKGPSATLFGGDAIAGVVNFITKNPEERPVTTFILNQTSALGSDVSVFNSRKFSRFGYTFLGSANYQKEYDVDDDDFTELPRTVSFGVSPKLLFAIDPQTNLVLTNSTAYQTRKGGDVFVLRGQTDSLHQYFEQNESLRNVTTLNFDRQLTSGGRFFLKQSLAIFDRELITPGYTFKGRQFNSYSDASLVKAIRKHSLVFGGGAFYDRFAEDRSTVSSTPRDETRLRIGGYIQDTVDITNRLSIEAGFRLDHARNYGIFGLPRFSVLYRFSDRLTTRIGFGMGYKTPTVFTEDAEELLFRNVLPIGNSLKAERSRGGTFDINYKNQIGESFSYSINQMLFFTAITDPLVLIPAGSGTYRFANSDSTVVSRGIETNARLGYRIANLFFGYTFTDATAGYLTGDRRVTLLPRHKINSSLVFEKHENFKAGVEFYYGSRQILDNRSLTPSLAEVGLFGEKTFGKVSIFVNAENLTDVRQGRYGQVVFPPSQNPTFAEIYAHTEGRIFNGGVKIRF